MGHLGLDVSAFFLHLESVLVQRLSTSRSVRFEKFLWMAGRLRKSAEVVVAYMNWEIFSGLISLNWEASGLKTFYMSGCEGSPYI